MAAGREFRLRPEPLSNNHRMGVERVPIGIEHLLLPPKMRQILPVRESVDFRL